LVQTRKLCHNCALAVAQGALQLHIYLTPLGSTDRAIASGTGFPEVARTEIFV